VLIDVYSVDGRLKEELASMPVPGTYKTWRKIEPPLWASTLMLRALDDLVLTEALSLKDRRRARTPPQGDRVQLTVTYAEKDKAKAIGAKWDPSERVWWIPADDPVCAGKARELGFL
jgi:hypothetical protein